MFDQVHVERLHVDRLSEQHICLFFLFFFTRCSKHTSNVPDDVTWSESMINADPGVDSQSSEEVRRSRKLDKYKETAMMLERHRRMRGPIDFNYQVDSMMTCPCEIPPSLTL